MAERDARAGAYSGSHWISTDLVKWTHLPIALWDDEPFDSVATYTGSATVINGSVALVYPGVRDGRRGLPGQTNVEWLTCSSDGAHHYNT